MTLTEDPWAIIGYLETDSIGVGTYANCVRTGFDLVSDPSLLTGRAFIVHAEDGSRISCGIIEEASSSSSDMPTVLETETTPIPGATSPARSDNGVSGTVQVLTNVQSSVPDGVCYQGYAVGLEPDVESFLLGTGSEQCNVTNGCGTHVRYTVTRFVIRELFFGRPTSLFITASSIDPFSDDDHDHDSYSYFFWLYVYYFLIR